MERYQTIRAYSAGGVVFRLLPQASQDETGISQPEVALVGRSHSGMWALPKGTPQSGETIEQVAVREVQEETGLQVRLITYVGLISYSFIRDNVRYYKQVRHFLFEAIGGDIALHDHEYDRVAWYPFSEAFRLLTYQNEANILSQAEGVLQRWLQHRQREGLAEPHA
ncbi:MAG TPA: NUDIX hydrolase [Ktedonobacteraceae bacterium]|nr:NUDIX hydrolase [Ktedonobacteraceae bacterium]